MALFKISKGPSENLSKQALTEGFAWFTPDNSKFYIDATVSNTLKRIPINPDGTTSAKGLVKLSSAIDSTSTALAATPSAVKKAYDLASKADTVSANNKTLISGLNTELSNVKTDIANVKTNINQNIATKEELKAAIGSVFRYKGTKPTYADLPPDHNMVGDVYTIIKTSEGQKDSFGETISNYDDVVFVGAMPAEDGSNSTLLWASIGGKYDDSGVRSSINQLQGTVGTVAGNLKNYLPLAGGEMVGGATISWADSGNWGNSNKGVTFPVDRGGLRWRGQSDGIDLRAVETANDNLELQLKFIDDNSNGLSILNASGTQTARIAADGKITATSFVGDLTGTASEASHATKADSATSALKAAQDSDGSAINTTYLKLSGGTMTGQIQKAGKSSSWILGRNNAALRVSSLSGYSPAISIKTNNGSWEMGAYDYPSFADQLTFYYGSDVNYNSGTNNVDASIRFKSDGTITAAGFNGNATSADKLTANAGSATIPVYFKDGKPVAITSYAGNASTATSAVAAGKATNDSDGNPINTTYLKKSGGTLTGDLYINVDTDVGKDKNGSLVIGSKEGANIGIDGNEIMARNNSAASTLYLNNEGGTVQIGGSIQPASNNNLNIGTSSLKYNTVYATNFNGNASTATKASSADSAVQAGKLTTDAGSNSVPVYFSNGKPVAITNNKVTIAGNDVTFGSSLAADTLRTSLGLSNAMHFIGITTVAISDGSTTDPKIANYSTKAAGDVIIDKESAYEYVWTGTKWERLGPDGSYKIVQTAVTTPSASGSDIAFIDTIAQNANGVIALTKKNVREASSSQSGIVSTGAQTFAGDKTFTSMPTVSMASGESGVKATRTDTGVSIWMGVGSGGANRGIYDVGQGKWLFYNDGATSYLTANTIPLNNNQYTLGSSSNKWSNVYATTFTGNATSANTATVASGANRLLNSDTRSANQAPSYYMPSYKGVVDEFKTSTAIGLASGTGRNNYVSLLTITPWYDNSGARPVQIAVSDNKGIYVRGAKSDTEWNSWGEIVTTSPTSNQEFTKNLALTTSWMDTGISGANLETGSYVVQVSNDGWDTTGFYGEIWTGTMSWYSGATNSTDYDEIVLHKAGHASNGKTIYLRTIRTARPGYLKLQICGSVAMGASDYTFKFKKLI